MKQGQAKQKNIYANMIFNALLTISQIVVPLITFPYFSRILMPDGMGSYNFLNSFVAYFAMFASLGIPTYAIKECARVRNECQLLNKTVKELMTLNVFFSVIAYIAFGICVLFIDRLRADYILCIFLAVASFATTLSMQWVLQALEEYKFNTIKSVAFNVISVVFLFIFVKTKQDLIYYVLILSVTNFLSAVINFFYVRKFVSFVKIGNLQLKRHIKPILIFFLLAAATSIYTNLDNIMLGFMRGDDVVGIYNGAIKINRMLVGIVTAMSAVLLPRLSFLFKNNRVEEMNFYLSKAINIVFILSIPLILYFTIFAQPVVQLFLGSEYLGSVLPMQISNIIILFIGLSNVIGIQYCVTIGKERTVMHSVLVGAIIDFLLNLIVIPKYGALGAAASTMLAELAVLSYQLIATRKQLHVFICKINWKYVILSPLLFVIIMVMKIWLPFGNLWSVVVSVCVTGAFALIMMIVTREEILFDILRKIFNSKKNSSNSGRKK